MPEKNSAPSFFSAKIVSRFAASPWGAFLAELPFKAASAACCCRNAAVMRGVACFLSATIQTPVLLSNASDSLSSCPRNLPPQPLLVLLHFRFFFLRRQPFRARHQIIPHFVHLRYYLFSSLIFLIKTTKKNAFSAFFSLNLFSWHKIWHTDR